MFVSLFVVKLGPDAQSVEFKELLENEKSNFRLINTAVSFLGGVPAMINPSDMSNTIPNEKVQPQTPSKNHIDLNIGVGLIMQIKHQQSSTLLNTHIIM